MRWVIDVAQTVKKINIPMSKALTRIMRFRPIRSAKGAKNKVPKVMPNKPALNTMPNAFGPIDQALAIAGRYRR